MKNDKLREIEKRIVRILCHETNSTIEQLGILEEIKDAILTVSSSKSIADLIDKEKKELECQR